MFTLIGLYRNNNHLKLKNWKKSYSEYTITYSAHLQLHSAEWANNCCPQMGNLTQRACRLLDPRNGRLSWFLWHLKFMCRMFISLTTLILSRYIWKQNSYEAAVEETKGKKVVKQEGGERELCVKSKYGCALVKRKSLRDGRWEKVGPSTWWKCLKLALWRTISTYWQSCLSPLCGNKTINALMTDHSSYPTEVCFPCLDLLSFVPSVMRPWSCIVLMTKPFAWAASALEFVPM